MLANQSWHSLCEQIQRGASQPSQLAQLLCPTADISLGFPNQLQQKEVLLTTQPCQNTTLGHVPSTPSTTTYLAQNPVSTSLPFSIPIVITPVIRRSSAASLQVYTRVTTCGRHAIPFHAFWRDVEISVSFQQFTAPLGASVPALPTYVFWGCTNSPSSEKTCPAKSFPLLGSLMSTMD